MLDSSWCLYQSEYAPFANVHVNFCALKDSFALLPPFWCLTCLRPLVYVSDNRLWLVTGIFLLLCSFWDSSLFLNKSFQWWIRSHFGPIVGKIGNLVQEEEGSEVFLFQITVKPVKFESCESQWDRMIWIRILRCEMWSAILRRAKNKSYVLTQYLSFHCFLDRNVFFLLSTVLLAKK